MALFRIVCSPAAPSHLPARSLHRDLGATCVKEGSKGSNGNGDGRREGDLACIRRISYSSVRF